MWLTKQLGQSGGLRLRSGLVQGGAGFSVQGEKEFRSPRQVGPYGLSSRADAGYEALMLGGYCAGVVDSAGGGLGAGEVKLYSSGGAEILLKNNGDVVINGQTFQKAAEEES